MQWHSRLSRPLIVDPQRISHSSPFPASQLGAERRSAPFGAVIKCQQTANIL